MSDTQDSAYVALPSTMSASGSQGPTSNQNYQSSVGSANDSASQQQLPPPIGLGVLPPRIELESIYEGLRAGLSIEQWRSYKDGLTSFLRGL